MIKIEQVRLLEQRVQKVITRVGELQAENTTLREELQTYQDRISDLEARLEGYASSQEEIEAGILSALQRLDEVEDTLGEEGTEGRQIEVDIPSEPESVSQSGEPLQEDEDQDEHQELMNDGADQGDTNPEVAGSETADSEAPGTDPHEASAFHGDDHHGDYNEETNRHGDAHSEEDHRQEGDSFGAGPDESSDSHQTGPELDIF
ncbi:Protein of unknown function [Alkalispirochaeta americana]|uniref:Cell division protein ZapB n=1 Tax=Alkalispirochaeta americana TaxID=159291 RepID=A0A1N6WF31_9SPIO|nr:cell division protein ZapB [Alkalispirochaeta americana]SIQ88763.1 Protein of unknown function [Alkalispirochaeta americana]